MEDDFYDAQDHVSIVTDASSSKSAAGATLTTATAVVVPGSHDGEEDSDFEMVEAEEGFLQYRCVLDATVSLPCTPPFFFLFLLSVSFMCVGVSPMRFLVAPDGVQIAYRAYLPPPESPVPASTVIILPAYPFDSYCYQHLACRYALSSSCISPSDVFDLCSLSQEHGVSVFIMEFRGSGASGGTRYV